MTRPTIRLRNSATRRIEPFAPIDPDNVRLYLCGPTVYDRAHLGNARNVILFDVLARLLRHDYGADHVTYARNVTDVDDKINARAAETGRSIREVTEETLGWFHDDMAALGNAAPDLEPRATEYIPQMIAMIEELIAKGHAYAADGHVLFAVDSFADYGALSGRSVDDMIAGARVEVAPFKRDPMDFVLWKPSDADQPGWDSPWGRGRPGWHIECSAMTRELLGPAFDIHGGGTDLMFPHHENELAQSCCADPDAGFARVWLHNEMLQVEGRKMSKSLGNFFTVRDLLDRGIPGEVIRFVFLGTHYSKPMDWTGEKAREAEATLRKWRAMAADGGAVHPEVLDALRDDLNAPGAIAVLHRLAKAGDGAGLRASAEMLGLLGDGMGGWLQQHLNDPDQEDVVRDIEKAISERNEARSRKDFVTADAIRAFLQAGGIALKDDGPNSSWSQSDKEEAFGWAKLYALACERRINFDVSLIQKLGGERRPSPVQFELGGDIRHAGVSGSMYPRFNPKLISLASVVAAV
ncbi:cysteine--tRNA ligase [Jannaschia ovalis]|uniref:Cysteine--tRNA ligase n=1 Tax=Jannaschia ovalis TaxID=3038773 RepID=A0ABY8LB28_9RHOB|nr:cysteine--tRNA ligase [Jannaschia sp. GRR-S6-38]WGH78532.1 cysteine--tRNA ligase [Jannaschia sp. GRR-S6-38]